MTAYPVQEPHGEKKEKPTTQAHEVGRSREDPPGPIPPGPLDPAAIVNKGPDDPPEES
jgi:hypothetical protein